MTATLLLKIRIAMKVYAKGECLCALMLEVKRRLALTQRTTAWCALPATPKPVYVRRLIANHRVRSARGRGSRVCATIGEYAIFVMMFLA